MKSLSKLFGAVLVLLFMIGVNPALAEGVKAWNEVEVLEISDELSKAARRLKVECRNSPPKYISETSGRHLEFRYHVRHFMWVSHRLNNALEDGAGREETKPMYDTLAGMKKGLNSYANMPGGAWVVVDRAVENVDKNLTQLEAYYAGG